MNKLPDHPYVPSEDPGFGGCWHLDSQTRQRCGFPPGHHTRQVPVTLHVVAGDAGRTDASGFIADTPENREALEAVAIPRCREWREANPEPCTPTCRYPSTCPNFDTPIGGHPAPYCCSAYCDRCAGLRALNEDDPALLPNDWMRQ